MEISTQQHRIAHWLGLTRDSKCGQVSRTPKLRRIQRQYTHSWVVAVLSVNKTHVFNLKLRSVRRMIMFAKLWMLVNKSEHQDRHQIYLSAPYARNFHHSWAGEISKCAVAFCWCWTISKANFHIEDTKRSHSNKLSIGHSKRAQSVLVLDYLDSSKIC